MYERVKLALKERPDLLERLDPHWFDGPPQLVICGTGHIAKAVCRQALDLDFPVTLLECDHEQVDAGDFPMEARLIVTSYQELKEHFPSHYMGLILLGHDGDSESCIRAMLDTGAEYIGVLSSKKRAAAMKEELQAEGYPETALASIYAPVGIPIHGVTPKEIAVSVLAEIIQVKNELGIYPSVSEELLEVKEKGCLCVIVDKQGHGPRGVGSMMYVTADRIYDSIGGSKIERAAIETARTATEPLLQTMYRGHSDSSVEMLFIPVE